MEEKFLFIWSLHGHLDVVKLLIVRGANVNQESYDGQTTLSYASHLGHADVVKLLLENGADVNKADKDQINSSSIR